MCKLPKRPLVLLGLLVVPALAATAAAGTIHVPADQKDLSHALQHAQDGDEIVVADGTYAGGNNKNLDFHGKQLVLRSENGPAHCVIDCEGAGRAFHFHGGEGLASVVQGLTLANGNMNVGGAVYCKGSSPTVRDWLFTGNTAHPGKYHGGGAMALEHGSSPLIEDCVFSGNQQIQSTQQNNAGGALAIEWNSNPTLKGCQFVGNHGQEGGAIAAAFDS